MNFQKKQNRIKFIIIFLCLLISVGYGAIVSNLSINGELTTNNTAFNIKFKNLKVKQGSVAATTPANINTKTGVAATFTLNNPGDYYEFTVDVKNQGSIDGMIKDIVKIPDTNSNIKCEITYNDAIHTPINKKDKLARGENLPILVRVEKIAGGAEQVNLTFSLDYIKADGTAREVLLSHKLTVDLNGGSTTQNFETNYLKNQEITLMTPSREEYRFIGWKIEKGNGVLNGNTFKMGSCDTTIKAKWSSVRAPAPKYCTYNPTGGIKRGTKYTNGKYTYVYKQEFDGDALKNISEDGWGVRLTDKESTDPVTDEVCTYINNKPVVSMSSMFYDSKSTSIDLSKMNTSEVTNMRSMFFKTQATELDVSHFDTHEVTDMLSMLRESKATTLDVSHFDTSKVTTMANMFTDNQATTLDLSSFDTSKVTNMVGMFWNAKATTIDVSHFDTSNVTNMWSMFEETKATTLDVSSFDTSKVTNMNRMFCGSVVEELDLSNFDTSKVTNMSYMFSVVNVKTLDLSNFDTSKVTDMNNMFSKVTTKKLDLSNFDTSNVINMKTMFWQNGANTLNLSNFDTSKVTDMSYMFQESAVTELDLSNFDTSNVTNMKYMFSKTIIKELDLSKFNTSKVTNMEGMFWQNKSLTLNLINFDTSKVTNMKYMFQESAVTELDLSSFDTSQVTDMSQMFYDCDLVVGYVRNQAEANKFNDKSLTSKSGATNFVVKS